MQSKRKRETHSHSHSATIFQVRCRQQKNDDFVEGEMREKKRANKQIASELGLPLYFEPTISIVSGAM